MSKTIDNRVVEMGFDNKQFETGVKTSVSSLDTLKKSLNLDSSAKSLLNLSNVGKNFSLENIASGVQNVSSKFSALGVIGFTVLQNLTNSAINLGKKLLQSLTAPIKTGLAEYETQINAIQTVLANTASKGTTLEEVNAALDKLNTYADKTIYNFTEMTKNIGTFTAAGVDLQTSVDSIKGIANLAAVSGSNSQQAATAMYQLSQAISSGTVRLMDWNSVVNAGMGGQVFQDALKETARVNGIAVDDMIAKNGSFRESLQEGWLSSKILTETLAKFTGDLNAEQLKSIGYTEEQIAGIIKLGQMANDAATKVKTFTQLKETIQESLVSGWAQSWRIVMGDFEEAKSFFTEVSETLGPLIQSSSDARNKVLQDWKDWGGRGVLIDALRRGFEGLLSIIAPIKEAFVDIFPPKTLESLISLTRNIWWFADGLKISGETADQIKRIFSGLFAALDIAKQIVVALVTAFFDLAGAVAPSGDSILEFLARIGDYVVNLREAIKTNDIFNTAIQKIKTTVDLVKNGIISFATGVKEKFDEVKKLFSGLFKGVDTSGIDTFFDKISLRFEPLKALFKGVAFLLKGFLKLAQKASPLLFKLASSIGSFVSDFVSSVVEGAANLDFSKIFDAINSGLILTLILAIKNFVNKGSGILGEASGIFSGITGILDGVRGSLEAWQQNLKAKTLLLIASSIGILTISLIALSTIDSKKLTMALGAVTTMFLELMGAMALYSKVSGISGGAGAGLGLVTLSVAILIMAGAISKLAKLKPEELDQGLGAVAALSIGLVAVSKLMSKNTSSILTGAIGLIAFAAALSVLVGVVEKIGSLDPLTITNGLIGVGVMLAEIVAFMKLVDLDKMGIAKGIGLLILAGSIVVMASAVEKFANMDPNKMTQGLVALGLILAQLAIFTKITGSGAGFIATAVGMVILGGAILIFSEAISRLGNLSWEEIAKGLVGMAGSLLIIFAAIKLFPKNMILTGLGLVIIASSLVILSKALTTLGGMTWDEIARGLTVLAGSLAILTLALYAMQGTIMGSVAILLAASALAILAPALQVLGSMSLGEIGASLLVLAGVFVILGIAGYALTPVIPTLLGLGTSMLLIGVAAVLVGAGLLAFSVGLSAIAVSGAAAAVAIVAMITTILGVIPVIIKTLIDAIIVFGEGIIKATPVVRDAILALLLAVLDIIIKVTPKLLQALTILLKGLIKLIIDVVPDFIDAVLFLLGELLTKIAEKMPDFVQSGFDILIAFLEGIRDNIADVVTVVSEIVVEFLNAVADNLPEVIQAGWDFIIDFINGMADSVDKNMKPLLTAIGRLATSIIDGLVEGIGNGAKAVLKALSDVVTAAIDAIKKKLGIASPSTVFAKIASWIPLGIVVGINKFKSKVISTMSNLGNATAKAMSDAISKIDDILNVNTDMSPTIRPVLDLSEIISGKKEIDRIIGAVGLNVVPVVDRGQIVARNFIKDNGVGGQINTPSSTISLTQINNSPIPLSRIEIYRQTRNQLLALKGLVKI